MFSTERLRHWAVFATLQDSTSLHAAKMHLPKQEAAARAGVLCTSSSAFLRSL